MKSNVNVFVGVVLCAVLCGMFVWLRSAGEEDTWKPNEIYDQVHSSSYGASYTNATFSGSPQEGGLAVSMSSSSSMRARHATNFYAGAGYAPTASSPLSSSVSLLPSSHGGSAGEGLYTTSSAEMKSFGGGGNGGAAMGGSARGNSVSNPSPQGGIGVGFVSSPIAYSTARRGEMSSTSGTNPAMMLEENPAVAVMGAANAANGIYGAYSVMDYSASANYNQYTGMFGSGRMGVRGRQNVNPWDSWLSWLYDNETGEWGTRTGSDEDGWIYTYSEAQLRAAYEEWVKTYGQSWGPKPPSFEAWWEWMLAGGYDGYEYGNNTYRWVPVGSIIPLLLLALLYVLFITIKSKPLKSLLKTERSK